jgi:ACT domain-containing protein
VLKVEKKIDLTHSIKKAKMATIRKRFKPEQIVNLLREIEVLMANGKSLLQACKQVGISDKGYYRWRKIRMFIMIDEFSQPV